MEQVEALNHGPDSLVDPDPSQPSGVEVPAGGRFVTTRARIKHLRMQGIDVSLAPPLVADTADSKKAAKGATK